MKLVHSNTHKRILKLGLVNYVQSIPFSIAEIEEVGKDLELPDELINEAKRVQKNRIGRALEKLTKEMEELPE